MKHIPYPSECSVEEFIDACDHIIRSQVKKFCALNPSNTMKRGRQAAEIAVVKAYNKFDPAKKVKPSTFVTSMVIWGIQAEIMDSIKFSCPLTIQQRQIQRLKKFKDWMAAHEKEHGSPPTHREKTDWWNQTGMRGDKEKRRPTYLPLDMAHPSCDEFMPDDQHETWASKLEDPDHRATEEAVEKMRLIDALSHWIDDNLEEDKASLFRYIIDKRGDGVTWPHISHKTGVSIQDLKVFHRAVMRDLKLAFDS